MKFTQKIALGLCAFYLISVIGVALSMHFCGGNLASISITDQVASCKLCKEEPADKKDDGCCKNTKVDVKVDDSHQASNGFKLPKLFSFEFAIFSNIGGAFNSILPSFLRVKENKAPPRPKSIAIHVFNCVFRN